MATVERVIDPYGRVIVKPDVAFELLYRGVDISNIYVEDAEPTQTYNGWCQTYDKTDFMLITPEHRTDDPAMEHETRSQTWFVPEHYREIAMRDFLHGRCATEEQHARVDEEMDEFEARGLVPLLQTMVFLVDDFRLRGVVWGVGRGSSVASYCLYLIGVPKIDPLRYGLKIGDFLK